MRSARSRRGLSIRHRSAKMFRAPPEISLPITTPPWPSFIVQLRTITFSIGVFTRRPSLFRPDFRAMQSSPVSNVQPSISTSRHDSGSQPSLFGPWLRIETLRTVTFWHSTGWISHIGELTIVTPSMRTLRLRYGWMKFGRSQCPAPNTRSRTGTPRAPHVEQPVSRRAPASIAPPDRRRASSTTRRVGLAVERPGAGDRDVLRLEGIDERRVVHQLGAFEAREDERQVLPRVAAEGQRRFRLEVQVDAAGEPDPAGQESAGRHDDACRPRRRGRWQSRGGSPPVEVRAAVARRRRTA